jgi:hypothetical protein
MERAQEKTTTSNQELAVWERLPFNPSIHYINPKNFPISSAVEQFKLNSNEFGEVSPIDEPFDYHGCPPVIAWKRKSGSFEWITGRHRVNAAIRSNKEYIAYQIVNETDGWNAQEVKTLDVELNIRDGHGSSTDFIIYFRHTNISERAAKQRGLLREETSRLGYYVGTFGCNKLYLGAIKKSIRLETAAAIACGAKENHELQEALIEVFHSQLKYETGSFEQSLHFIQWFIEQIQVKGEKTTQDYFNEFLTIKKQVSSIEYKSSQLKTVLNHVSFIEEELGVQINSVDLDQTLQNLQVEKKELTKRIAVTKAKVENISTPTFINHTVHNTTNIPLVDSELYSNEGEPHSHFLTINSVLAIQFHPYLSQFKHGANELGVVNPISSYTLLGAAPIFVYVYSSGEKVVGSGKHKFQSALESKSQLAIIQEFKESEDWTLEDMKLYDYIQNIREGHIGLYELVYLLNEQKRYAWKNSKKISLHQLSQVTNSARNSLVGLAQEIVNLASDQHMQCIMNRSISPEDYVQFRKKLLEVKKLLPLLEYNDLNMLLDFRLREKRSLEYLFNYMIAFVAKSKKGRVLSQENLFNDYSFTDEITELLSKEKYAKLEIKSVEKKIETIKYLTALVKSDTLPLTKEQVIVLKRKQKKLEVELSRWKSWPIHEDLVQKINSYNHFTVKEKEETSFRLDQAMLAELV